MIEPSRIWEPNRDLTGKADSGTIYNTMNPGRIRRLRRRIRQVQAGKANVRSRELRSLARSVGRVPVKRGKHPTFERKGRPPLTIPIHPGAMSPITVDSILDILEEDLDYEEGVGDG